MVLMLYAVQMLFFGLALLIAARPGLDNPGCYRDGWDVFRGICEGMTFVIYLGQLALVTFVLITYVAASGIRSIYSCMSYVGALSQYAVQCVRTSVPRVTEMHFCSAYIYIRSSTSSAGTTMYISLAAVKCGCIPVHFQLSEMKLWYRF